MKTIFQFLTLTALTIGAMPASAAMPVDSDLVSISTDAVDASDSDEASPLLVKAVASGESEAHVIEVANKDKVTCEFEKVYFNPLNLIFAFQTGHFRGTGNTRKEAISQAIGKCSDPRNSPFSVKGCIESSASAACY